MEFDNENSRCVSAGPEPDARVCVTLRGDRFEIDADGDGGVVLAMMASALAEVIKEYELLATNGISKTQIYKMAGNSIVVTVLEHLFKQIYTPGTQSIDSLKKKSLDIFMQQSPSGRAGGS